MPSPVDKYVKQVKESNPDYSEAQAWATAWSIYCKHKNPGSEHCKKDPSEYLKGKNAMTDESIALRVAAIHSTDPVMVRRVASRFFSALNAGENFENEAWRVHRYMNSIKVTDLTNAGKRGKKVTELSLYEKVTTRQIPWESIALEIVMHARRKVSLEKMKKVLEEQVEVFGTYVALETHARRGIDTMPGGFIPVKIEGKYVDIEATPRTFSINDKVDKNNLPACIPAISGGLKSIPVFFRWVQDNEARVKDMKFNDILADMRKEGIEYHSYCRMD